MTGLRYAVKAVGGRLVPVVVTGTKDLPRTQKCDRCQSPATKRVLHAEGMAYVPACEEHLAAVKADLGESEISGVREIPAAKAGLAPSPKLRFDAGEHPRDRLGKFVEVGGTVAILGGGTGQVLSEEGGGRLSVRLEDGRTLVVDSGHVTMIRSAASNAVGDPSAVLDTELRDAEDPVLPAGDRDAGARPQQDETGIAPPELPAGAEPAPDADPAGALSQLRSPSGDQVAWLRTDEGDLPVGYLRTATDDPATTVRFADGDAWATEVDRRALTETDVVPPPPVGAGAPDNDLPPAAEAPVTAVRSAATAAPDQVRAMLLDGLAAVPSSPDDATPLEDEATMAEAKRQVAAGLAARMADLPDEDLLSAADAAEVDRLRTGDWVMVRRPRPGVVPPADPSPADQLGGWEFAVVPLERWRTAVGSGQSAPEDLEVVTADQWRAWKREEALSAVVSRWAFTSNGDDVRALALQEATADLFGMEGHSDWEAFDRVEGLRTAVQQAVADRAAFHQALLIAQYEATQDALRAAGIREVELFRGFRAYDGDPEWSVDDTTTDLPLRPLSSFTSDESVAGGYARSNDGSDGFVVSGVVPAERILSMPRSGFGYLGQSEFVVLAGPGTWNVRRADARDGAAMDGWSDPLDFGGGDDDLYDDEGEDLLDPVTAPPGLLSTRAELASAIAAAEDPARRVALTRRAGSLRMGDLVPDSWGPDGQDVTRPDTAVRGPDGLLQPLDDDQLVAHVRAVEDALAAAKAVGLETSVTETLDGAGEVWTTERAEMHAEIVDAVWATGANVPADGRLVFAGGLGGVRRSAALADPSSGIDQSQYLTVDVDDVKALMAARGMVPDVPDATEPLSPAERLPLVHEEAVHIADLVARRAAAERRNLLWELPLASRTVVDVRASAYQDAGYQPPVGIFVDSSVETSVRRLRDRYRADLEAWRNGSGTGGRWVPPAVVREAASTSFSSANRAAFEEMRDSFADWQVWDDSVDGRPPRLVYYKGAPGLAKLTETARDGATDADRVTEEKALPGIRALLRGNR